MEAILLAGGFGTRLQSIISDVPKPMAPIGKIPFIQYIFDWLIFNNISRVILAVGYKWECIYNVFGNEYKSLKLIYSIEDVPLGTGGAIKLATSKIKDSNFFIINGDTLFLTNFKQISEFHNLTNNHISIALKPMHNSSRYGSVEIDNDNNIINFREKFNEDYGLINGGVYLVKKDIFSFSTNFESFSFEKDFLPSLINKVIFKGIVMDSYFIDIGIPDDYKKAQLELPSL